MAEPHLLLDVADGIAPLTLNRPDKRNAQPRDDRPTMRRGSVSSPIRACAWRCSPERRRRVLLRRRRRPAHPAVHRCPPAGGGRSRLGRQVPWARAAEIVLLADPIPASEALAMGLVNRAVPSAEVVRTAEALAQRLAANGPLALRKAKEVMVTSNGRPLEEAFGIESRAAGVVMASEDAVRARSRSWRSDRRASPAGDAQD